MTIQVLIGKNIKGKVDRSSTEALLNERFGNYPFVTRCNCRLSSLGNRGPYETRLELLLKNDAPVMVSAQESSDYSSLIIAVHRAKRQLDRYKENHYKSSHNNVTQLDRINSQKRK